VGVAGGIPSGSWSQFGATISAYGTNGSPGSVSTINNALTSACNSHEYVLLGGGTFWIDGPPIIKCSYEVLRGSAAESNPTIIEDSGPSECVQNSQNICLAGNQASPFVNAANCTDSPTEGTCPGNAYAFSWTGGYAQGATSITVASVGSGGINNGEIITLDQANSLADNGGAFVCDINTNTPPCHNTGQSGTYAGRTIGGIDYQQQQHVRVVAGCATACVGSGPFPLTITPGLYAPNWNTTSAVGGYFVKPITNVGLEDMTIDNSVAATADSIIGVANVDNWWIKNVRTLHGNRNHVWAAEATHGEWRDSYAIATINGLSESYGLEMYDSSDNLTENNIYQQIASPNIGAGGDSGNIFAYNFSVDNFYTGASGTYMQTTYLCHDAGNLYELFEGNQINGLSCDNIHGTSALITAFRNWVNGQDYNTAGSPPYQPTLGTQPIATATYARGMNFVGNVLGTPGYHVYYQSYPPSNMAASSALCNLYIYDIGAGPANCGYFPSAGIGSDPITYTSMFFWGDYDVANGSVQWPNRSTTAVPYISSNAMPSSHTLPASFYQPARPSFWGSMPWPAVGPDVTGGIGPAGMAYRNPAAVCYYTTMNGPVNGSGNPLPFDANVCYGSTPPPTRPNPPTGVAAVTQ
jgi:hypothetical protein